VQVCVKRDSPHKVDIITGGNSMGCGRAILCIIFPPLAVIDRGCGTVLIVLLLTLAGWIPGAIAALILNYLAATRPPAP
jgi:uncharacterized membrane protein YqaE (UPF0057 family)